MTDYIPSTKQKRLEKFAEDVAADLLALQDRVKESEFKTDEFAHTFERCFRGVAENYQVEKLGAFRGILVNSAIGSNIGDDERAYFLRLVDTLSALHLRILSFMTNPRAYLEARNLSPQVIRGGFSTLFLVAIPGVNIDVVKAAFGDLF